MQEKSLPRRVSLDDEMLSGDLRAVADALFLGHYTEQELREALRARGFWDELAKRGFPHAELAVEATPTGPRAAVRANGAELGELRASVAHWGNGRAIVIDWLEMRHPTAAFPPERPRLPGQSAPGLGIGRKMVELLAAAAERVGADAIVVRPQHYHNAVLYQRIGFRYADPAKEKRFEALVRSLRGRTLAEGSWAVEKSAVLDPTTGAPVTWAHYAGDMVMTNVRKEK